MQMGVDTTQSNWTRQLRSGQSWARAIQTQSFDVTATEYLLVAINPFTAVRIGGRVESQRLVYSISGFETDSQELFGTRRDTGTRTFNSLNLGAQWRTVATILRFGANPEKAHNVAMIRDPEAGYWLFDDSALPTSLA
jgi:hypothetical protein